MVQQNKFPSTPIYGPGSQPQDLSGDNADTPYLGIYTQETTQRFMLGTRYITWDGRVFKYAKSSGTWTCSSLVHHTLKQEILWNALTADQPIGSYQVECDVDTTDADGSGNIVADALSGGYVAVFGTTVAIRGIVANNAVVTGSTNITLDLDAPCSTAWTTSHSCEAMSSPYYGVNNTGDVAVQGHVGRAVMPCVSGEFGWIQTWGVCFISPQANVGAGTWQTGVTCRTDGSLDCRNNRLEGTADYQQPVGFVISNNDAAQALPFIMLQISI